MAEKLQLSPQTLEIAAQAWLNEWRRQCIKRNPHRECTILTWEDYGPAEQQFMMKAIKVAFAAAQPDNVKAVLERRAAE